MSSLGGSASSPPPRGYELLDAGDGRRLERFGDRVVDRPSPAATMPGRATGPWAGADLVFDRDARDGDHRASESDGRWLGSGRALAPWTISLAGLAFELRPTPAGQVGLFPEQLPMLQWLASVLAATVGRSGPVEPPVVPMDPSRSSQAPHATIPAPPVVLNLYAYTGAVTLACAQAGAAVVHVDASRPAVGWARHNAALSGLAAAPVRWIVDDARAFVAREVRRGHRYQGLVLDPPTYGHGPRGVDWRLERDLGALLDGCARLLAPDARLVLLTAHTPGHGPDALAGMLADALGRRCEAGRLDLAAANGVVLRLGAYARWSAA